MNRFIKIFIFFILAFFISSCIENSKKEKPVDTSKNQEYVNIRQEDIIKTDFLPSFGKWMYTSDYRYANWLGAKFKGKTLREPINIIIVDSISESVDEAKDNLIKNFDSAGFKIRKGHSSGYLGYIDKKFYTQIPEQSEHAFSDAPFELNNCHGRVFGPCNYNGVYYFTAALSKEKVVIDIPIHHYDSFNEARDKLAENLNSKTHYKILHYVNMLNSIDSDSLTTGDHDGRGILISVTK